MNNKKCPDCNLCCDLVYTPDLKMYWRCWLCGKWYISNADGVLTEIVIVNKEATNGDTPAV